MFKEYRISDIGEVIGGGTPSTKNDEYWNGNIPWISPKDLTGYNSVYISYGKNFITDKGLKSGTRLLPKDTVLFSSRAPIGYIALLDAFALIRFLVLPEIVFLPLKLFLNLFWGCRLILYQLKFLVILLLQILIFHQYLLFLNAVTCYTLKFLNLSTEDFFLRLIICPQ